MRSRHTAAYTGITAPRWGPEEREYQRIPPKKPYVHGTGHNNALIHKINYVRLQWWTCQVGDGSRLVRLQSPHMTAITNCGQWISIDDTRGKVCDMPKPDAVLCAACHGKGRNFPRNKPHDIALSIAKVRLGCIETPL